MGDRKYQYSDEDILRYEESAMYEEKIRRLEDSICSLRLSRRVLMSLLEQSQGQNEAEVERLRRENRRLRRQLSQCVQRQWQRSAAPDEQQ